MSAVHAARRERLMRSSSPGLVLVRGAAGATGNRSFFYLTGLDEPRAALLLAPQGVRIETGAGHPGPGYVRGRLVRQLLFLPRADALLARWGEDSAATVESVSAERAGVDAVLPAGELESVLERALQSAAALHVVPARQPALCGEDDADASFVARVRRRFFGLEIRDAGPLVHDMRRFKDEGEVAAIERAAGATRAALERVLALLRPAIAEHELECEIGRVYRAHGGGHAFSPIVAGGVRALKLHYRENSGTLDAGSLVLIDTGAAVCGYGCDVTRTYPAGGRFDVRQREVYAAVLAAQRETIAACRPGATLADLHEIAWRSLERAGFAERFLHGTSHHIGLETHDVGDVHRPLGPGCVITVEPGVYLDDEGLGIRLEDDVLLTAGEPRVLTASIPIEPEAIEAAMARAGR